MKAIAIVLNLILLGAVAYLLVTIGGPEGNGWLLVIPMIAAPLWSVFTAIAGDQ